MIIDKVNVVCADPATFVAITVIVLIDWTLDEPKLHHCLLKNRLADPQLRLSVLDRQLQNFSDPMNKSYQPRRTDSVSSAIPGASPSAKPGPHPDRVY